MKPKVGFMGLGIMGTAMASNILRAGYALTVYNRTEEKTRTPADLGAGVARSPKALAGAADVIILMVTGPEAINDLLWGPEGAGQVLDDKKVLINMSSVSPRFTRELHQRLAGRGVTFIDAPVSGTKKPAEEGTLLILAAGDREKVDAVTPLLETMGKKVIYCGETGQGSMMKMTINLLLGLMMEGFAEVLQFGKMGGLSMETMLDVVFSGPLHCSLYQVKSEMIQNEAYPTSFPLKHMTKDIKFVVDTAYETGAAVPAGHTLLHLYSMGVGQQWGDLDFAAVAEVLKHISATKS